jgi:HEAT repeat protein
LLKCDSWEAPDFWWTEEDVLARSPFPQTRSNDFRFPVGRRTENPFPEWCYYHFLSADSGKAFLISLSRAEREVLSHWSNRTSDKELPSAWRADYPSLQVVTTGFSPYSNKTATAFALVLGEGGDDAVPRLAALLQQKDRRLRRLVVNALRMMGPLAQKAIPALIEHLCDGPVAERIDVAYALAAIGGEAIQALKQASTQDDPWIRVPADIALAKLKLASGQPESLIRQVQKRLLTRERFFYLLMQHLTEDNVAEILDSMPSACLKILKTQLESWPPGLEVGPQQSREGLKAMREYLVAK